MFRKIIIFSIFNHPKASPCRHESLRGLRITKLFFTIIRRCLAQRRLKKLFGLILLIFTTSFYHHLNSKDFLQLRIFYEYAIKTSAFHNKLIFSPQLLGLSINENMLLICHCCEPEYNVCCTIYRCLYMMSEVYCWDVLCVY